jgi:hypothetical protein
MVPRGSTIRQFPDLIHLRENKPKLAHVWYVGAELYQDEVTDNYWCDGIPFYFTISDNVLFPTEQSPVPQPDLFCCGDTNDDQMQIHVKTLPHEFITSEVKKTDRLKDLKTKIQNEKGIAITKQSLSLLDRELKNEKAIQDYSIKSDETLALMPLRPAMQIFIELLTGRHITLYFDQNDRVRANKNVIDLIYLSPPDDQILGYAGLISLDRETLGNCSIEENSTLQLVIRMKG